MNRLFRLLFLLLVSSVAAAGPPTDQSASDLDSSGPSLQEILKNLDEAKVHEALHLLSDKFRHGVFPTDANAVEALQKENASLGARLLKIAKRQSPENSTSSASPPPVTSEPVPPTSHVSSTSSTKNHPTETHPTQTTPTETIPTETAPTKTVPTDTAPTDTAPTGTPPTDTAPANTAPDTAEHSTADSSPPTTTAPTTSSEMPPPPTSSPPPPAPGTPSQAPSTLTSLTKAPDTIPAATQHSGDQPFTSTFQSTTTLPNGSLSTVTDVAVVHPTPGSGNTPTPGLQNGGVAPTALTKEIVALMGGAVIVAMAL